MKRVKGQADIIASVLLIVLVLAGIFVVWGISSKLVFNSKNQVSGIDALKVSVSIEKYSLNNSGAEIRVKRKGSGDLTGLKFIFYDKNNANIYSKEVNSNLPLESETQTYFINVNQVIKIKKISVVPVFGSNIGSESEKELDDVFVLNGS